MRFCFSRTFFFRRTVSPMIVNSSLINKDLFILFFPNCFFFILWWVPEILTSLHEIEIVWNWIFEYESHLSIVQLCFSIPLFHFARKFNIAWVKPTLWIISILVKLFSIRFSFHGDWHNCRVIEQRRGSIKSSCNPIQNSSNFPLMMHAALSLVLSAHLNIHELFEII